MNKCQALKKAYLNELNLLLKSFNQRVGCLTMDGSKDEAILETIKANVGDIFLEMFNISYNTACKGDDPENVELTKLYQTYIAFFDKIPAPWKEKMAKDKEYHLMEEYYKEEVKLLTAENIKNLFIEHYRSYSEEV